jgi:hypothetical protein
MRSPFTKASEQSSARTSTADQVYRVCRALKVVRIASLVMLGSVVLIGHAAQAAIVVHKLDETTDGSSIPLGPGVTQGVISITEAIITSTGVVTSTDISDELSFLGAMGIVSATLDSDKDPLVDQPADIDNLGPLTEINVPEVGGVAHYEPKKPKDPGFHDDGTGKNDFVYEIDSGCSDCVLVTMEPSSLSLALIGLALVGAKKVFLAANVGDRHGQKPITERCE